MRDRVEGETLSDAVTLGARSFQKDEQGRIRKGGKRHPTVEDDVIIYPNSTILGGKTVIGRGTTIGGNVFLVSTCRRTHLFSTKRNNCRSSKKRPHDETKTHNVPRV